MKLSKEFKKLRFFKQGMGIVYFSMCIVCSVVAFIVLLSLHQEAQFRSTRGDTYNYIEYNGAILYSYENSIFSFSDNTKTKICDGDAIAIVGDKLIVSNLLKQKFYIFDLKESSVTNIWNKKIVDHRYVNGFFCIQ